MATIFNNEAQSNSSITLASGNTLVFGTSAFWTMTATTPIISLGGTNLFRNAGQVYADVIAVRAVAGSNRVENLATGVIGSSTNSAIALLGGSSVVNAGHISGREAILFTGTNNSVVNTGTIVGTTNTLDFGDGTGTDDVHNSGTIISTSDDAIEFGSASRHVIDNSGLISAVNSTAILLLGTGAMFITNSGTIAGLDAMSLSSDADVVVNSGSISGGSFLNGGDDLFDSSLGVLSGVVNGGVGNDTLIGGVSGDHLEGGAGNDVLTGNDGNDVLAGGFDGDDLDGGAGRDAASYADNGAPVLVDLANPDANLGYAAGDTYTSIEVVIGSSVSDQLFGDGDRNTLRGGAGTAADLLDGRGGADLLIGGAGNDQYVVDNARDRVVEIALEGVDSVRASASYVLPNEVENLTLTGGQAIDATGNGLANDLTGNSGANVLAGGLGNDVLTGGGGADGFRFDTALGAANVDAIIDFTAGADRIQLSRAIFTALNGGQALNPQGFFAGTAANDTSDRIIHDAATGEIFYDADGTGAIAQILFARVTPGIVLTPADFAPFG